jgi:hypothetical protein
MRKWVIFIVFLAIVFGVLYYLTFGYYSEGKRGGFVTQLSKKGYLFKTYEGELRMGGLSEGDGTMNSSQWVFSVSGSNKEAIAKIEQFKMVTGFRLPMNKSSLPFPGMVILSFL